MVKSRDPFPGFWHATVESGMAGVDEGAKQDAITGIAKEGKQKGRNRKSGHSGGGWWWWCRAAETALVKTRLREKAVAGGEVKLRAESALVDKTHRRTTSKDAKRTKRSKRVKSQQTKD